MSYQPWQPVDENETWERIVPGSVIAYMDDTFAIIEAKYDPNDSDRLNLEIQRPNGERFNKHAKKSDTVMNTGSSILGKEEPVRVMTLPELIWSRDKLTSPRNIVALLAMTLVLVVGLYYLELNFLHMIFLVSGLVAAGVRRLWKTGNTVEFIAPDRLGITMDTVHAYVLTREQGKLWISPTPGADRRQLAFDRVASIRNSYLDAREDIVRRIEQSALFDAAVPATAAFEAALVEFDDVTEQTPTDRVDELASRVEVAYNVAEANAERLGLEHLPETARDDARRAGKAARLAASASTPGERQASLRQVKKILDALALYYLPTINEKLELEAGPAS